jgi:hypothetical protein
MSGLFECRVGGILFPTTVEVLLNIPGSFFQTALSDTWNASGATSIHIERDGTHFQIILDYLRFGYLPRDPSGRCHIEKEILEAVVVEADFYGLTGLVKEIEQLLKFNLKGMRYYIVEFFLNSGSNSYGALSLKEFATEEEAVKVYEDYKKTKTIDSLNCGYIRQLIVNGKVEHDNGQDDNQNIVINEVENLLTGKTKKEVFEDGTWKRPRGLQLLCLPLSTNSANGVISESTLRAFPDNRDYY